MAFPWKTSIDRGLSQIASYFPMVVPLKSSIDRGFWAQARVKDAGLWRWLPWKRSLRAKRLWRTGHGSWAKLHHYLEATPTINHGLLLRGWHYFIWLYIYYDTYIRTNGIKRIYIYTSYNYLYIYRVWNSIQYGIIRYMYMYLCIYNMIEFYIYISVYILYIYNLILI